MKTTDEFKANRRKVRYYTGDVFGHGLKWLHLECGHEMILPARYRKIPDEEFCRACWEAWRLRHAKQLSLFRE